MKKLSFEDGLIVLRELDGKLFWSIHHIDLKDKDGGYKTILIEGVLLEQNDFVEKKKEYII